MGGRASRLSQYARQRPAQLAVPGFGDVLGGVGSGYRGSWLRLRARGSECLRTRRGAVGEASRWPPAI